MGAIRDFLLYIGQDLLLDEHAERILDILFHRCEYVNDMLVLLDFYSNQSHSYEQTLQLCRHAQELGQIRKDISPELCATMLHTTTEGDDPLSLNTIERLQLRRPESRVDRFPARQFWL